MNIHILIGQIYEDESGEEYEVINVATTGIKLQTSDGEILRLGLEELLDNIEARTLVLQQDVE